MGDDFLIGYRISIKNSQATHENLSVSKSMTPCNGQRLETLTLLRTPDESLRTTLLHNEEEFFSFATTKTFHIKSLQQIETPHQLSTETLTLPTHCYAVEFNDDTATITLLQ